MNDEPKKHGGHRIGAGRPPTTPLGAKESVVYVRTTPYQKADWVHAASRRKMTLSEWAAEQLDRAALRGD